jgi:uncharacterized protein YdhG (YjbR/CyaY superfamily)
MTLSKKSPAARNPSRRKTSAQAKTRSSRTGARKKVAQTVEDYLAGVPEQALDAFTSLRAVIRSAVPADAAETISYGIPAFRGDGILVWYAAFANHCSLFPTASVIQLFRDELKSFSTSKGTIHFPLDKPLPVQLVKRIVKARVAQKKGSHCLTTAG